MASYLGTVPVEDVHHWKTEATQRLLGSTIALTESEWHQPVALPGWTRAHVASHLARHADYLRSVLLAIRAGVNQPPPPSRAEQRRQLERGADRPGIELQIDLDAASGGLQKAIENTFDWTPQIQLNSTQIPLSALPLARLHDVTVHHLDISDAMDVDSIPAGSAEWLLRWVVFRMTGAKGPRITISGDKVHAEIGRGDNPVEVLGTDARLWGWLTGRLGPEAVVGADDLRLPFLA